MWLPLEVLGIRTQKYEYGLGHKLTHNIQVLSQEKRPRKYVLICNYTYEIYV